MSRISARSLILVWVLSAMLACGGQSPRIALIQNTGSDSMLVAATAWAEAYKTVQPDVGVVVSGGGSGVGVAGLFNGTVDIANLSRRLSDDELELARSLGFEPQFLVVGYDAPAFVVHEDNPLTSLSFAQIAEIYGEGGGVTRWSQLGVTVPGCDGDEIVRASRLDSSGTRRHLQRLLLPSGQEFKLGSLGVQGSKSMVELVSQTPCAIGYVGLAYAPPARVKIICISGQDGEACVVPSMQSAVDETYPLARPLLMVRKKGEIPALEAYLSWVRSDQGQCLLRQAGYAPFRPVACQ